VKYLGIINPYFRTNPQDYSKEERVKLATKGLTIDYYDFYNKIRDLSKDNLEEEIAIIAKSYGIYMEFNRDKVKLDGQKDKEWIYMIRITIPGGGPINSFQWRILDEVSNKYTVSDAYTGEPKPSLKLTTRQDVQLHHVKKKDLVNAIREIAESGFFTLNGCGDNVRNTIACPLSYFSPVNVNILAQRIAKYFRLPTQPYIQIFEIDPNVTRDLEDRPEGSFKYADNLLNRKFKIGIAGVIKKDNKYIIDNCIEVRSNDVGIVPILNDNEVKYQIYVGGSMGEHNAYPTFSALAQPLGICKEEDLIKVLDAIVSLHQEWGDRKNRHWARLKYLVYKMGIKWIRERIKEYTGIDLELPKYLDLNNRDLHLGKYKVNENKWAYGIFVENGRLIDGPNGKMKTAIRYLMDKYEDIRIQLFITPNQHIILANISEDIISEIEKELMNFGYGFRYGKPYSMLRINSTACVGFPTCKLSFTDSERYLPKLIDKLEEKGIFEEIDIGLSGCMAQCSRPATRSISWVGSGFNLYMLKIGGDQERLGEPLIDWERGELYLYQVPANEVPNVTYELIRFYLENRRNREKCSEFFRRIGNSKIIEYLKSNENTKHLMKPYKMPSKILGYRELHELEKKIMEELYEMGYGKHER
jgi:sulfite reductase (NADPH) hemoprotein beta-component